MSGDTLDQKLAPTSANLAALFAEPKSREALETFITNRFCQNTWTLVSESVAVRNAMFAYGDLVHEIFAYLVEYEPQLLETHSIRRQPVAILKRPQPLATPQWTIEALIQRYGESVFTERCKGKSGVSCVRFLFALYGIPSPRCKGACSFKHTLDYHFGVPLGFAFKTHGEWMYYWRKMKDHRPTILKFKTLDVNNFANEVTTCVPIGVIVDERSLPKGFFD